jgi:hypothetical protein
MGPVWGVIEAFEVSRQQQSLVWQAEGAGLHRQGIRPGTTKGLKGFKGSGSSKRSKATKGLTMVFQ